ncbi:MAG TPA: ABC transporter ATP-binding protein [Gemmatimonadales bacterium]|nr:ABC transporter ATP-binding protein [Gemmatimonadales bacterium]
MSAPPVVFDSVYKKFKRGELYDSLRDLIPAMTRRLLQPRHPEALERREFWALNDVSFEVKQGEALGVVGANGAGKSTVLKLLSGIMRPTMGAVRMRGRLSALIEVGAGFHPDLTGRENIFLNGTILGMTRAEIARKFDAIVDFAGMKDFIDTPVKRYSSGMFARLGFAVAAHVDPDILVVDEVLSVGDYVFQQKCQERMEEVIRSGATVIFVSHNLRAVADLCPRSLLMERGKIAAIGPSEEVLRAYMQRAQGQRVVDPEAPVALTRITVRDAERERLDFRSGEQAFIDVEVRARVRVERIAVVLDLHDESHYSVFNTSSERLGTPPATLDPGDTLHCTFALDLHLGAGAFNVGLYLHRYDAQKQYDHWFPAATMLVTPDRDIRGAVSLYPTVQRYDVVRAGAGLNPVPATT